MDLSAALGQLLEVATGEVSGNDANAILNEAIEAVQELRRDGDWSVLEGDGLSAMALTRALGDILKLEDVSLRSRGASIYATLLSLENAPAGTLCDPFAFAAFVHCLKGLCLPNKRSGQQQGEDGPQQEDGTDACTAASPLLILEDIGSFLRQHSLRGSPEMVSLLLDALVDITGSAVTAGSTKTSKAAKRTAARAQDASVADVAFALLPLAIDSRHGDVAQMVAVASHRLVPTLLGTDAGRRSGGKTADRRTSALQLVNQLLSAHVAARPCRVALMRQLCVRAPDKADCRQLAVASVQSLVTGCTAQEVHAFCLFLHRLSCTSRTGSRLVAVELAASLLANLPSPFMGIESYQRLVSRSCGPGDELEAPWSALCLCIMVKRSSDKSASVRCKAMGCLADSVQPYAQRLQDGLGSPAAQDATAFVSALCASRLIRLQVTVTRKARRHDGQDGSDAEGAAGEDNVDGGNEDAAGAGPAVQVSASMPGRVSPDINWLKEMCYERCRDDKAAARKAALVLLECALELYGAAHRASVVAGATADDGPTAQDVQVLEEATADALVSVRKAALQVVCSLLRSYPAHSGLAGVWARCVLPMVRDPEGAVQDAVLDHLSALLVEPIGCLAANKAGGRGGRVAAAAEEAEAALRPRLAALGQMGRAASGCLGKAMSMLMAKKQLRSPQVAAGLEAFLSTKEKATITGGEAAQQAGGDRARKHLLRDQREGAWIVLVEVAAQDPSAPSWQFLQRCWAELQSTGTEGSASAQEGAMLLWVIGHAASRFPASDATQLAAGLLKAVLGFNLPCAAAAAHVAALHRLTQAAGGQDEVGTPAQWCARVLETGESVLAQAMEARGNLDAQLALRCQLALFTLGEVALLREAKVSGGIAVKVQALTSLASLRPGSAAGARPTSSPSSALAGHAWTCLGKLCMADEALAKKCVPLLVQEMSSSPSPVVRSNLLVALSDMIVQFTGLADAYVGRLAAMVRDPHELVRHQALALLANLLLRDYVKWRGALVHRFLLALVDESATVRQLAQYLLSDSLASKAPMLAYNHFIESLFVLNDCRAGMHASRAGGGGMGSELQAELALHSAMEGTTFHFKGPSPVMRAKRDIIYAALARRMSPEQRFAASAKLVAEVLGGVVDGLLPLSEAEEVLGDALRLLASKDMKVNVNRFGAGAEDDGGMDAGGTQEDSSKARGKLVGAMMRKHLAESVVPLMVELRYMLQAEKHPLLGSLMLCMATLLRDYKSEIEDILVSDKQLAKEILHDLKQYETMAKQQQQQQEAAMAAALGVRSADPVATATPGPAGTARPNGARPGARVAPTPSQGPRPSAGPQRRVSILPGVDAARTPVAAELLLATATKRRGDRPHLSRQNTPYNGPAAAGAAAKTPIGSVLPAGCAMMTPRTGLPGGARYPGPVPMPTPAPMSARARRQQGSAAGAPTPGGARPVNTGAGPSNAEAAAADIAAAPATVVLPSPLPDAQQRRPLSARNAAAAAAAAQGTGTTSKPGGRNMTPPAVIAAAVVAARRAAAAAVDEHEDAGDAPPPPDAPMEDRNGANVVAEAQAVGRPKRGSSRATKDAGVKVKQEAVMVKQEAAQLGPLGVHEGAAGGGRSRASKRRQGA